MITAKVCRKCSVERTTDDFHWYTTKAGKRLQRHTCKVCIKEAVAKHRQNNPRSKHTWAKWTYNIDAETYDAMMERGCDVCGSKSQLSIDHDHGCCPGKRSCGECVRGVLCRDCNWAEGLLGSDVSRIMALAAYLVQYEREEVDSDYHG